MSATHSCLVRMYDERHQLEDYQGGVPRWCNGCGDNAILAAVQRLCRDEDLRRRTRCSCRVSAARAASRTT